MQRKLKRSVSWDCCLFDGFVACHVDCPLLMHRCDLNKYINMLGLLNVKSRLWRSARTSVYEYVGWGNCFVWWSLHFPLIPFISLIYVISFVHIFIYSVSSDSMLFNCFIHSLIHSLIHSFIHFTSPFHVIDSVSFQFYFTSLHYLWFRFMSLHSSPSFHSFHSCHACR